MIKSKTKTIGALTILLMLSASHLSVNYTFAENEENQVPKAEFRTILTEKIVDGKLQVSHYTLSDDLSEEDLKRMLSFEGQMSWAYVKFKAYQSGIVLFDGKVSKIGEDIWKISIRDQVSEGNLKYKVVFSGKIAETDGENVAVVALMNSIMKDPEISQKIRLMETGETAKNVEKSNGSHMEFRNYYR